MFPGDSADNLHLLSPIKEPTFIIEPAGFSVHSALSKVTVGLQRSKVSLVEEPGGDAWNRMPVRDPLSG